MPQAFVEHLRDLRRLPLTICRHELHETRPNDVMPVTLVVSEASADARFSQEIPDAIGYEVRSLLTAPLSHDGESLGVLQLLNRTDPGPFTPAEVDTLSQLGRLSGALIGLGWRLKALTDAHGGQA